MYIMLKKEWVLLCEASKFSIRVRKLSDGKSIRGKGQITKVLMNSLQNYYGGAIRRNRVTKLE